MSLDYGLKRLRSTIRPEMCLASNRRSQVSGRRGLRGKAFSCHLQAALRIPPDGTVTPCLHVVSGNTRERALAGISNWSVTRNYRAVIYEQFQSGCACCCSRTDQLFARVHATPGRGTPIALRSGCRRYALDYGFLLPRG
jgi:Iron-sulfur cluster-binding domain